MLTFIILEKIENKDLKGLSKLMKKNFPPLQLFVEGMEQ